MKEKAVWTENTEILLDLLKSRGVDIQSCVGACFLLATDAKYKEMIEWINKHPRAKQNGILSQLDVFKKAETKHYPMPPSRKIAVF